MILIFLLSIIQTNLEIKKTQCYQVCKRKHKQNDALPQVPEFEKKKSFRSRKENCGGARKRLRQESTTLQQTRGSLYSGSDKLWLMQERAGEM